MWLGRIVSCMVVSNIFLIKNAFSEVGFMVTIFPSPHQLLQGRGVTRKYRNEEEMQISASVIEMF